MIKNLAVTLAYLSSLSLAVRSSIPSRSTSRDLRKFNARSNVQRVKSTIRPLGPATPNAEIRNPEWPFSPSGFRFE